MPPSPVLDESEEHIIRKITRMSHEAAGSRSIVIVAENEPQDAILIDRDGVDALWNDDWHHSAMVAATGRNDAYYTDYLGRPQEFLSMIRSGFLYQGQYYSWQKDVRGTLSGHLPAERLICYLQNHDQVANSATGQRLHDLTSPGKFRALTALLLLGPNTPMLFQGEEFGASSPFLYFADHQGDLAQAVAKGRVEFLHQFPSITALDSANLAPPDAPATFERSRVDPGESERHPAMVALHRDLLAMRKNDPAFSAQRADCIEGAVLGEHAFLLRFAPPGAPRRLLLINLGSTLQLTVAPEPLLALPRGKGWRLLWSSESPLYGGSGAREPESEEGWQLPPECALVLEERETSIRRKQRRAQDRR
jgi:1,4-alpha-glucan branching enzyme